MIDALIHWVPWCIAAYAVAAILWPVLRWPRGPRAAALPRGSFGLLLLPIVVSADRPLSRALVAIFAGTFVIKLYDLHCGAERGSAPTWPAYLLFLASPFCHVSRRLQTAPRPTGRQNFVRLAH
ncbi:MAG: hypothetical protein ACYTGF_00340 [Planctomycetota bacterium]